MLRVMPMRFAVAVLSLPLVVACTGDDPEAEATACGVDQHVPSRGGGERTYFGLSEDAAERMAEEAGLVLRVLGEDGECRPQDSDRRSDRLNVYMENDKVTAARIF